MSDDRSEVQDYLREQMERQGLEEGNKGFQLTPKAYRLFQSKLLTQIFDELQASRRLRGSTVPPVCGRTRRRSGHQAA